MSLQELIANYGYWAVLVGTFLEGETILVLGGLAASRGYLELPLVMLVAFIGTVLGDQLYFYIGRFNGQKILAKKPRWQEKSARVFDLMARHEVKMILGYRFLYGIRTVTPFLIGASRIHPLRFLVLNLIGSAIWAVAVATLGYLFGEAFELFMADAKKYEIALFGIIILTAFSYWFWQRRKKSQRSTGCCGDDH